MKTPAKALDKANAQANAQAKAMANAMANAQANAMANAPNKAPCPSQKDTFRASSHSPSLLLNVTRTAYISVRRPLRMHSCACQACERARCGSRPWLQSVARGAFAETNGRRRTVFFCSAPAHMRR